MVIGSGLELVGLCAVSALWGASILARTRLCVRFASAGESVLRVHKAGLRQTVERQRRLPKLKVMLPVQIAERVVASIRANCANLYPITPDDLDDEILRWCAAHGIERPCPGVVREEIAMLAGVRRKRVWLTGARPMHAYIRERQRIRGKPNDRPTLYWIDDLPDVVMDRPMDTLMDVRPGVSIPRPSPVQSVQTRVRPQVDVRPDTCPKVRKRVEIERRAAA